MVENLVSNNTITITKDFSDFVVIGLGNFGKSLALALAEEGKNVLAIDKNAELVDSIEGQVTHAVVADATKKMCLVHWVFKILNVQSFV